MKYDLRSLRHEADIACHLAEGDDDSHIDARLAIIEALASLERTVDNG